MPQRCEGRDSWAWKCQVQSACSLHDQSPAPPASSVAPLPSELPSSWSPQPYRQAAHKVINVLKRLTTIPLYQTFRYLLFGFFISPYFGISLGTLQFSFGIRKLVPFSINLKKKVIVIRQKKVQILVQRGNSWTLNRIKWIIYKSFIMSKIKFLVKFKDSKLRKQKLTWIFTYIWSLGTKIKCLFD